MARLSSEATPVKKKKKATRKSSAAKLSLPQIYEMVGYQHPQNILVVGCGGTGGHLIPHLARMVSVLKATSRQHRNLTLTIADGDIVEDKNLQRQNFIHQDLDVNKAEVLAKRYSRAFGIEINAITSDLENSDAVATHAGHRSYGQTAVVVGCVDNNASRKLISEWFGAGQENAKFWLDSGNEEKAGQIVCGYRPAQYSRTQINNKKGEFSLPNVFELFPEMAQGALKLNSELSCAERAQSAPQNMQTNVTAATLLMNFLQKILRGEGLKSHAVDFSIDNAFSTKLNTPENLSKVELNRRRNWENYYV